MKFSAPEFHQRHQKEIDTAFGIREIEYRSGITVLPSGGFCAAPEILSKAESVAVCQHVEVLACPNIR